MSDEKPHPARKCAVATAQIWYDGSKRKTLTPEARLMYLENAFNHTENALFATQQRAEKSEKVISALLRALNSSAKFIDEAGYPKISAEIRGVVQDCINGGLQS